MRGDYEGISEGVGENDCGGSEERDKQERLQSEAQVEEVFYF